MFLVGKVLVRHQIEQIVITVGFAPWLEHYSVIPAAYLCCMCACPLADPRPGLGCIYECWVVGGSSRDRTITGFTPPNEHQTATTLDPLNVTYDPVKILKILKYFKSICL